MLILFQDLIPFELLLVLYEHFHLFEEHSIYLVSVYQFTDVYTLLIERFYFVES